MKNSLSEMTAFEKASIAAALTDTVTKLVSPRETGKTSSEQLADAVPKVYATFCDIFLKIEKGDWSTLPKK